MAPEERQPCAVAIDALAPRHLGPVRGRTPFVIQEVDAGRHRLVEQDPVEIGPLGGLEAAGRLGRGRPLMTAAPSCLSTCARAPARGSAGRRGRRRSRCRNRASCRSTDGRDAGGSARCCRDRPGPNQQGGEMAEEMDVDHQAGVLADRLGDLPGQGLLGLRPLPAAGEQPAAVGGADEQGPVALEIKVEEPGPARPGSACSASACS